jgi:hypothetical protein
MPTVTVFILERGKVPSTQYDFDVAPRAGEPVIINLDGRTCHYVVKESWHRIEPDSRSARYYAALERDEERWTIISDYLET